MKKGIKKVNKFKIINLFTINSGKIPSKTFKMLKMDKKSNLQKIPTMWIFFNQGTRRRER